MTEKMQADSVQSRQAVFVRCCLKSTTYNPPEGISPKKAEKLAIAYAVEFENHCKGFSQLNENTKVWNEDVKRIIKVLLYTGMRSGECLGLAWEDIDFEEMTITINHNLTDIGGKHELGSPKTESSHRVIVMSDILADILKEQKDYIEQLSSAIGESFKHPEMVFTSALGNYRDRNSVYQSLKRFTKGTEFEDLTLHQLRHCNATLLLNSGVDLKIISEHLGHSGVEVT